MTLDADRNLEFSFRRYQDQYGYEKGLISLKKILYIKITNNY